MTRLELTIRQHFTFKGLRTLVTNLVSRCPMCQSVKHPMKQYGLLPLVSPTIQEPFHTVAVDLVGPYTIHNHGRIYQLQCLTIIDICTRWIEIVSIPDKSSETVSLAFDRNWLSRYPRPVRVIHDNGGEFASEFAELLESYGIQNVPTTIKNPTANATLERTHQVIQNTIRSLDIERIRLDTTDPFSGILANTAFALRATVHTTLDASPAQLVFGRDMIMHTTFTANWDRIRRRQLKRQVLDNKRENQRRIPHQYQVDEYVLIRNDDIRGKLTSPTFGPFRILEVNDGVVLIERGNYTERISIRRLIPFRSL